MCTSLVPSLYCQSVNSLILSIIVPREYCYLCLYCYCSITGSLCYSHFGFNVHVQNPMLSSAGGGLQPSVFASVKATSLQGSNMASLFSDHSSVQLVTCVSGCISPAGNTTFALASPSGSIHLIHLSPPHEPGTTAPVVVYPARPSLPAQVVPHADAGTKRKGKC